MVELYGTGFLTAYGEAPSPLWANAIAGLTDDECRAGCARLANQGREYPANLTQFVAACRYKPTQSTLGPGTTPGALHRALPGPNRRATPEAVDNWIAKMRKRVGSVAPRQERDSYDFLAGACTCRSKGECDVCRGVVA